MVEYLVGGKVDISANGTNTLTVTIPLTGKLRRIGLYSKGAALVTNIEVSQAIDFFDGQAVLDAFKNKENSYEFEQPVDVVRGASFSMTVTDLSGAANTVSVVLTIIG